MILCSYMETFMDVFTRCFPVRSSYWRCSVKKGALKTFANFAGKRLCWSLFLIKSQVIRPAISLKRNSNKGLTLKFDFFNLYGYMEIFYNEESSILYTIQPSKLYLEVCFRDN